MRMTLSITACLSLLSFAASAQDTPNSVIIDQVGPGSVNVKQSGSENSIIVNQDNGNGEAGDYQQGILSNPYTSPLARTEELPEQPESAKKEPEKKEDKKADNKKIDDTKKFDEKKAGSIHIKQSGAKNKASTKQNNDSNDLLIEQEGKHNN